MSNRLTIETLGDLVDAIRAVDEAESDVLDAERAIEHGGNESTMAGKFATLSAKQRYVTYLREQKVDLV